MCSGGWQWPSAPGDLQYGRDGNREVFGAIVALCVEQLVRSCNSTDAIIRFMRDLAVSPAKITRGLTFDVPAHEVQVARRVFEDGPAPSPSRAPAAGESLPTSTVYFMPSSMGGEAHAESGHGRGAPVKFKATEAVAQYLTALQLATEEKMWTKTDIRFSDRGSFREVVQVDDFFGLLLDRLRVEAPHTAVSFLHAIGQVQCESYERAWCHFEKVTAGADRQLQQTCATCGKNAAQAGVGNLKKCVRCQTSVRYCSANCQRADWPQHKLVCRRVR